MLLNKMLKLALGGIYEQTMVSERDFGHKTGAEKENTSKFMESLFSYLYMKEEKCLTFLISS